MGKRYPGAPNDVGTMHPIINSVMNSDMEHQAAAFMALGVVHGMFEEAVKEYAEHNGDDNVNIEDLPAYDRLTDLAIIGVLVEHKKFYPISGVMAGLSMEPCESFTKGSCMDEGSGKSFDAESLADRYCWPCRVRHALGGGITFAQAQRR